MTVRGIDRDDVHLGVDQRADPVQEVRAHAYGGAYQQSAVFVFCGIGVLYGFFDVFYGDQTFKVARFVHEREFFDAVFAEDRLRFLERGSDRSGNEVVFRHHVADGLVEIGFETKVAVRQYADEFPVNADRYAADTVFAHQRVGVGDQMIGRKKERVGDNAVLASLDAVDLRRLFVDSQVFVNDTDAAFPCHGYGEFGFRYGIHRRGHQRHVQANAVGQLRGKIDVFR